MDGMSDKILALAKTQFDKARDAENDNRLTWVDDIRFGRLGEQWPDAIKRQRELDQRPCLTINKLPAFIRQVVNAARRNKPSIKVHPADSHADTETAEIINGLIRNIEVTSDADIATDTAIEAAVAGGFGYFRINIKEAYGDTFDKDIAFERIINPLTVYADPFAESADGSDWSFCFVVSEMEKDAFADKYKGKDAVDWDSLGYSNLQSPWLDGDHVMVAEYWKREEVEKQVIPLIKPPASEPVLIAMDEIEADPEKFAAYMPAGEPKTVNSYKVTQYVMTGAEVLETIEWPGCYIPIVPVYGDEVIVEGKRFFRSLIADAKDPQRQFNYWRTMATELVALAPKAPFIGRKGAFETDRAKWSSANTVSHSYIEFDGPEMPSRQAFAGVPAGALQEALNAADDMKAVMGIYDASLGARSNETSGRAIAQRQEQGDTATFHFLDNLARSIRHSGRILIDLIPKVYSTERMVRVLGQDMKPQTVQIAPGAEKPMEGGMEGQDDQEAMSRVFDITAGKYDLTVSTGPSYSSQREETRSELVEIIRSNPESAQILGPLYLRNCDWPGADEAADKLEGVGEQQQIPPEVQQHIAQLEQQLQAANQQDQQLKQAELQLKSMEIEVKRMEAQADLIRAQAEVAYAGQPRPSYGAVA